MKKVTIALAQCHSIDNNIATNVDIHLRFARQALDFQSDLIIFPELSLTGYNSETAQEQILELNDIVLTPLFDLAKTTGVTVVAGAPVPSGNDKPNIGCLVISPNASFIYRKHYLHPGEELFFAENEKKPGIIEINGVKIGLAICADINHADHPDMLTKSGIHVYAAGVLMMGGYDESAEQMKLYAKGHSMLTLMANYGEKTGGHIPAGRSAAWNEKGELLSEARSKGEEIVIVSGVPGSWSGKTIPVN